MLSLSTIKNNTNPVDLLLSSLLEYFCLTNNNLQSFKTINKYLLEMKIVKSDKSSDELSHKRLFLLEMLKNMLNTNKIPNKDIILPNTELDIKNVYEPKSITRYKQDFIEVDKIGNGGFGYVCESINKFDRKHYAIKKIPLTSDFENLYREVEYLSKLEHPNIVRYYNAWIEFEEYTNIDNSEIEYLSDSFPETSESKSNELVIQNISLNKKEILPTIFIQMELCNTTLKQFILQNKCSKEIGINIFKQIIKGVYYLHKNNIIHRDLKPANIFLDNKICVKIGDLGLAKHTLIDTQNTLSSISGTQLYAAPEQYNKQNISKKVDIYSLGLILLELWFPFNTQMEKIIAFNMIKENNPSIITDYCKSKKDKKILNLVKLMCNKDINKRPSIIYLFDKFCS